MLQTSDVFDWTHHGSVVFTISLPISESLVDVEQPLVISASNEEVPDQNLLQHPIEGRFGIKEDRKDRKL